MDLYNQWVTDENKQTPQIAMSVLLFRLQCVFLFFAEEEGDTASLMPSDTTLKDQKLLEF